MTDERAAKLMLDETLGKRAVLVGDLMDTIKGEKPRPGTEHTPIRVAKMYDELFAGYGKDAEKILRDALFEGVDCHDMVLVSNIQFYSMCEHHIMPFFGKVHIAYIPQDGRIVGLSKLARIVDVYARRLQVQERLGKQLVEVINKVMLPAGVAVIIEAEHTCMTARGVQKPGTLTKTAHLDGIFKLDDKARLELYQLLELNS